MSKKKNNRQKPNTDPEYSQSVIKQELNGSSRNMYTANSSDFEFDVDFTGDDPVAIRERDGRRILTANTPGFEFDTDFTGKEEKTIRDDLDLFFDGQEKEKTADYTDSRYEADSAFGVTTVACGKEDLVNLWNQKNDMLRQSIAANEKHLVFVKKKIEDVKFSLKFHIILSFVCVCIIAFLFFMRLVIWTAYKPAYVLCALITSGVLSFYTVGGTAHSIRMYTHHIKKDFGWKKPNTVNEYRNRRPSRERNFKAEYEKVNWILRQYDYEKELMFVIKTHIDSGEIVDMEELNRQLRDVFIYENVESATM